MARKPRVSQRIGMFPGMDQEIDALTQALLARSQKLGGSINKAWDSLPRGLREEFESYLKRMKGASKDAASPLGRALGSGGFKGSPAASRVAGKVKEGLRGITEYLRAGEDVREMGAAVPGRRVAPGAGAPKNLGAVKNLGGALAVGPEKIGGGFTGGPGRVVDPSELPHPFGTKRGHQRLLPGKVEGKAARAVRKGKGALSKAMKLGAGHPWAMGIGGGLGGLFLASQVKAGRQEAKEAAATRALPEPSAKDYLEQIELEELLALKRASLAQRDPAALEILMSGMEKPTLPRGGFSIGNPNPGAQGMDEQSLNQLLMQL